MSITLQFEGTAPEDSPFGRFSWTRAAVTWADEAGPVVRGTMKRESPVAKTTPDGRKGGRLQDSIRYEREVSAGSLRMIWGTGVPYARYVIEGTGPHVISAVAARYLRFYFDGAEVPTFRRSVKHPGTKPNDFPARAVVELTPMLLRTFAAACQASAEGA